MERIARFSKVSEERFIKDYLQMNDSEDLQAAKAAYSRVQLPVRGTAGSAGYDLTAPYDIRLAPGESLKIVTGIRAQIREGWVLLVVPRSSLGSMYCFRLTNGTGVVDADYYAAENEGHIYVKMINEGREGREVFVPAGKAFAQGVFVPFGITEDDAAEGVRNGGFGSTDA